MCARSPAAHCLTLFVPLFNVAAPLNLTGVMPSLLNDEQVEAVSEWKASRAKLGIEHLPDSEDDIDAQSDAQRRAAIQEQGEAWDKIKTKRKAMSMKFSRTLVAM